MALSLGEATRAHRLVAVTVAHKHTHTHTHVCTRKQPFPCSCTRTNTLTPHAALTSGEPSRFCPKLSLKALLPKNARTGRAKLPHLLVLWLTSPLGMIKLKTCPVKPNESRRCCSCASSLKSCVEDTVNVLPHFSLLVSW